MTLSTLSAQLPASVQAVSRYGLTHTDGAPQYPSRISRAFADQQGRTVLRVHQRGEAAALERLEQGVHQA